MYSIIQWICRGLRANFTDFRLLCDTYNLIVCCFQETMLTKDDFIIRGFNCIHLTSRDIGGRACGGVSVLVRDGIPSSSGESSHHIHVQNHYYLFVVFDSQ